MKIGTFAALASALILAGCASHQRGEPRHGAAGQPDWRQIATDEDRKRLREWRTAWTSALKKAQAAGHGAAVAREGALLNPDAAIAWGEPPAGDYHCRVIKIGGKSAGNLDYIAYPAFTCRIRPETRFLSFAKLTGSQRPVGHLLPHSPQRMVFLGTLQLGDETRSLEYGHDRDRDVAGFLERVGERRWRLVLPYPAFESTTDIIELIPKS